MTCGGIFHGGPEPMLASPATAVKGIRRAALIFSQCPDFQLSDAARLC